MLILFAVYIFIFGLCFGSFANVVIYRVPKNISIVKPPSHCPSCGERLKGIDLIPVISFILLKGRCRRCNKKISVRYPVIELSCGILFLLMLLLTGVSLAVIPLCVLAFVLLCVSVIDADTQEIPGGLLILGAAAGAVWIFMGYGDFLPDGGFAAPILSDALLGVLAGALPLFIIDRLTVLFVKKDGFGFGDVKLMAMAGLFIGWKLISVSFLFAFIIGGGFAAFLLITRRTERGSYLAFGPFLSAGIILAMFFGEQFLSFLL